MIDIEQHILEIEELTLRGEYLQAELESNVVLEQQAPDLVQSARLYNSLAECSWRKSQLSKALELSDLAFQYATRTGNTIQLAHALSNKATVFRERSHYKEALELYHEAFELSKQIANPVEIACAQMNIGNVLRQLQQHDDAAEYLQNAFELFSQHKQLLYAARVVSLIGLVCDERQLPQQALQNYRQALELFAGCADTQARDLSMAWLFKNIGNMGLPLVSFDESLDYLDRALKLFERIGSKLGSAAVNGNLGSLYADPRWVKHDEQYAEIILCNATQQLEELGDMHEQAKCHKSLASLYERQNRWELSSRHFKIFHELMQEVQSDVAKKRAAGEAYERRIAELRTEQEVAARYTNTIRKQLEIIQRDLQTAERIQQAILPNLHDEIRTWNDAWCVSAKMVAARSVGGDFYDVFKIDEHRFGVVIADVSGKGMPAALFMVESRTMLKMQAQFGESPGEVLKQVNSMLCKENVMSMFVTVFYAVFDTRTGEVTCANAGHNPPLILRANRKLERIDTGGGIILGIVDGAEYGTERVTLGCGESMFFYTDGVSEAMNEERELFGEERIEPWLLNLDGPTALETHINLMLQNLADFSAKAGQTDDITMLVVHRN